MVDVQFDLEGLDAVIDRLSEWGQDVVDAAGGAVEEAAEEGAAAVAENAPYDTGDLKASVEHSHLGWGLSVVQAGGPSAPHARPVESRTGWFNRTMQPVQVGLLDRVHDAIIREAF